MANKIKPITLHPINPETGTLDTNTNLYPKTVISQILEANGDMAKIQRRLTAGEGIALDGATNTISVDSETMTEIENKQDKLIAGRNITIEGNVISATTGEAGEVTDVEVDGVSVVDEYGVASINLTDYAKKSELSQVATTGDYDDLTNKPTIPEPVSGTNDGTNWTSLTIGNETHGFASGGTGDVTDVEVNGTSVVNAEGVAEITLPPIATELTPSSTNNEVAGAAAVYDNIQNVREVAEGKCNTFVFSTVFTKIENGYLWYLDEHNVEQSYAPTIFNVYNSTTKKWENKADLLSQGIYNGLTIVNRTFDSSDSVIDFSSGGIKYLIIGYYGKFSLLNVADYDGGTAISKFPLKTGDNFYITETDVSDRWYGDRSFFKLETSKINLSGYVTLDTPQRITAPKSFFNNVANDTLPLRIQGFENKTWGLEMDKDFGRLHFKFANVSGTNISNVADHLVLDSSALYPAQNNVKDLGTSSYYWKDFYLAGYTYFKDITGSVTRTWRMGESQYGTIELKTSNDGGTNWANRYSFQTGSFCPTVANTVDLGNDNANQKWRNLYLSGVLSDGTNSISIAQIVAGGSSATKKTITLVNDTWTQAQLEDVYTNVYDVVEIISSTGSNNIYRQYSNKTQDNVVTYITLPEPSNGINLYVFSLENEYTLDVVLGVPHVSGQNDGTNWTELTIGEDTYAIPQGGGGGGTNVVANPTLNGTEPHLDGIQVGSSKYSTKPDLSGKVISIMGDSISTYAGWIPNSDGVNDGTGTLRHAIFYPNYGSYVNNVEMTWWHKLIFKKFKAKLGVNESWSGSFVGNNKDTNTATTTTCHAPGNDTGPDTCMASNTRIKRLAANGTPDIIYVYGGTNDIAQPGTPNESLGSFSNSTDYSSVDLSSVKWSTFVDAYRTMIQRMQYYYPKAKIIALLPTYCVNYYNRSKLEEWTEQIKLICDYFGVNYIDLRACGITWANSAPSRNAKGVQTLGDSNIHPNALGHTLIADYVEAETYKILHQDNNANVVHTVTNTLSNLVNTMSYVTGVTDGDSYSATLTGSDLTIGRVSMGGVDITSTAYNSSTGIITIASVTGDIAITEGAAIITPVSGVSLNTQTKSLSPNDVDTLTATIAPANATNKNVTWSVNNANVTIVPNGLTCQITAVTDGTSVVTVTTEDGSYTASCTITVHQITLTSISITTPPSTTAYHYGDTFSPYGMVVTAYYDDNTSEVLDSTDYTYSPSGALTSSDTAITVSYTYNGVTKTATQSITVATLSSIAITTQPNKVNYNIGQTFDPTGMIVTATWSDNSTSTITGYTYSPSGSLTTSDTTITISYSIGGVTQTTTQSITVYDQTEATAVFGTRSASNAVSNTVFWQTNTDDMVAARGNQLTSITFNHKVTTGTIKVYGYGQSFDKTATASALASAATTADSNKTLLFTITPRGTGSQTYLLDGTDANVAMSVSTPITCPTSLGFDGKAMGWSGDNGESTNGYITFCSNSSGGNQVDQTLCVSLTYLTSSSKILTAITVTTAPTKTAYYEGEVFDPTGMVVTASWGDNTTSTVIDYSYSPSGVLSLSDTTITISYTYGGITQSTTQAITINQAPTAYYHTDNINLPLNAEAKPGYASFINYSDQTYFEGKTITSVRLKPYKAGTLTVGLINIANWSSTSSKTNAVTITVNANDVGVVTEYPIRLQCPVGYGPYIMETTDTATFYYSETGGNGFKNQVGRGRTPGNSDPCNLGVDFGYATE